MMYKLRKNSSHLAAALAVLSLSVLLRVLVGYGPYSGHNHPPRYGDFEAQRHWMELAVNSPPAEWYTPTPLNDLTWWRLDYPALSGYFAWLVGQLSRAYEPASVEPYESRGYEEPHFKNFMRVSVVVAELIFLYPALLLYVKQKLSKFHFDYQWSVILLVLICPLLVLVDHGHFQYNCVSVGLSLLGGYLMSEDQWVIGSVLFTMAFNFKQMALYYSFPLFAFVMGQLAIKSGLRTDNMKQMFNRKKLPVFGLYFLLFWTIVIGTMVVIYLPWITSLTALKEVLAAVFPIHRGLYQLKVATFWCMTHIFVKWEAFFSNQVLFRLSTILTVLGSLPAMACLFINPKPKAVTVGVFVVSQVFFLFGFHVHEKTILLPAVWLLLDIRAFGPLVNDYITIAGITMYPLMREDGLTLQYFTLWIFYQIIFNKFISGLGRPVLKELVVDPYKPQSHQRITKILMLMNPIIAIFVLLVALELTFDPPQRYPYLYPLLYAAIGFYGYLFMLAYTYLYLFRQTIDSLQKKKIE